MMQRGLHLLRIKRPLPNLYVGMRQVLCACVLLAVLPTAGALAQTTEPSLQERQAQAAQLQARRTALERAYQQDVAQCYQKFDVTSCRNAAREKHIEANAALRQQELAHSARERMLAAQEAQRRTEEKQRDAQNKAQSKALNKALNKAQSDAQSEAQNKAQSESQEGVAPSSASRAARDPQAQQREDHLQRAAYEQKHREAAQRRERLENRLRERDKPPANPLPMPVNSKPQTPP